MPHTFSTTRVRLLLTLMCSGVLLTFAPPSMAASTPACAGPDYSIFSVGRAAKVPAPQGGVVGVLGTRGALGMARRLTGGVDVCRTNASRPVRLALRRVARAYRQRGRAAGRRQLAVAYAVIRREAAHSQARTRGRTVMSPCSRVTAKGDDPRDSGVSDYVAAAAAAQKAGDTAATSAAIKRAEGALTTYGKRRMSDSTSTLGDMAAIAMVADQLGMDGLKNDAMDTARTHAAADVEATKKFSRCLADLRDVDCALKAIQAVQLLGADEGSAGETQQAGDLAASVARRVNNDLDDGCEKWEFNGELHSDANGWKVRWLRAQFMIDRRAAGTPLSGIDDLEVRRGWIDSWTSPCMENGVQVGTGSLTGGPFTYELTGAATATSIELNAVSPDAVASGSADESFCDGVAKLGADMTQTLARDMSFHFDAAPGQLVATISTADMTGTIRRQPSTR